LQHGILEALFTCGVDQPVDRLLLELAGAPDNGNAFRELDKLPIGERSIISRQRLQGTQQSGDASATNRRVPLLTPHLSEFSDRDWITRRCSICSNAIYRPPRLLHPARTRWPTA
jgi:hypothetical protein